MVLTERIRRCRTAWRARWRSRRRRFCAEGTYGTPRPRILLTLTLTPARGAGRRSEGLHARRRGGAGLRWVVCVQAENGVAWVDLELCAGLPEEVEAGLEAMRAVSLQGGR